MTMQLQTLVREGALAPLHQALGELIGRMDPSADPCVPLAAALAGDQLDRGHVCLDLSHVAELTFTGPDRTEEPLTYADWPALDEWVDRLAASSAVAVREAADDAEAVNRPLVLDATRRRLYLARYWYFQQRLARLLVQRIAAPPLPLAEDRLTELIARLFPKREQAGDRDQCLAVANAVDQRLSIITGGPGTGKTTTVAKLLAARLMLTAADVDQPAGLKVLLMAPTGKAAQRLNESLGRATRSLPVDDAVRAALEEVRAGTMHRLLGWTPLPPERGGPFLHTAEFPLEADVVLIDEASMVNLGLMWRLFDAVRPEAQVVLIGDRDQLASVEAGGVLSDLCGGVAAAGVERLSAKRRACVAARTGLSLPAGAAAARGALDDHVVPLRYSHRFDPASGLGQLAAAIRDGDAEAVIGTLRAADARQIQWLQPTAPGDALAAAVQCAAEYYADYLQLLAASPTGNTELLTALNRFRVLCAHRAGGGAR